MNRILALIVLLIASLAPAQAHRGHASLSVVAIDPTNGAVTVTHRFAAHDVEPALVAIAPDAQPSLDDPQAVAALIAYVGRHFQIEGATLSFKSKRLRGDDVMLVFSGRLALPVHEVTLAGSLFEETHDDHETQVNVRLGKVTRTLLFRQGDGLKRVTFGSGSAN